MTTGIAEKNYRMFRRRFKEAMADVKEQWRSPDGEKQPLPCDLDEKRLVLYRSPLLIAPARPSAAQEKEQRILSSRSFDEATRRSAGSR